MIWILLACVESAGDSDRECRDLEISDRYVALRASAPVDVQISGCGTLQAIGCTDNVGASADGSDLAVGITVSLTALGAGAGACAVSVDQDGSIVVRVIQTTTEG